VRHRRSAVCTLATGSHRELFEIARPGLEAYCARHGYDLVLAHHEMATGRPTSWSKVVLLRDVVESYDRVAWIDADAVVVDPTGDIFAGVGHLTPIRVVFHRYDGLEVPNLGVMAIASTSWSKRFLQRLWRSEQYVNHKWWENAAALELLGYDVREPRRETRRRRYASLRVGRLDGSWNSIPLDPADRPFISHFPGETHDTRVRLMTAAAATSRIEVRSPGPTIVTMDAERGRSGLELLGGARA
jgi:hypothetical protein